VKSQRPARQSSPGLSETALPHWPKTSASIGTNEVRASQFGSAKGDLDAEVVAIAGAIIKQRTGKFDPSTYQDRYQEALPGADRGHDEGGLPSSRERSACLARDRSYGGFETQPSAGSACKWAGRLKRSGPGYYLIVASRHCSYRCPVVEGGSSRPPPSRPRLRRGDGARPEGCPSK
jgi:hypothetical protein